MEWDPTERSAKENYRFLTSAVAPRPVAWVTTASPAGVVNAAPFSWFNSVSSDPPMLMLSIGRRTDGSPKDTLRNILETREFVVNVATRDLADETVRSAADFAPDVSEVKALGLATAPSRAVGPPRLAASPVHLECRLHDTMTLGRHADQTLVVGQVVHVAADDGVLDAKGFVDPRRVTFVARLGGAWYCDTSAPFEIPWPAAPPDRLRGGDAAAKGST